MKKESIYVWLCFFIILIFRNSFSYTDNLNTNHYENKILDNHYKINLLIILYNIIKKFNLYALSV